MADTQASGACLEFGVKVQVLSDAPNLGKINNEGALAQKSLKSLKLYVKHITTTRIQWIIHSNSV